MKKEYFFRFMVLVIVGLFFYGTAAAGSGIKKHKYFPIVTGDPQMMRSLPFPPNISTRESHPQFSTGLAEDSTTFTLVPTPFDSVEAGDAVWIDYDNDGLLDVLVSGGSEKDSTHVTKIYHNDGGGVFTDIHADIAQIGSEHGIAWGDYDNDGDYDLAISGRLDSLGLVPITKIYQNEDGVFVDINAPLVQLNGSALAWVDYDCDGKLDLFYTGSPDAGNTFYSKLYHNDGDGVFSEVPTDIVGVWGGSVSFADYDNDGYPDLLLTGYGTSHVTGKVYHNEWIYTRDSLGFVIDSSRGFVDINASISTMNSSSAEWVDYNNDGFLDIAMVGTAPANTPTSKIYRNNGDGTFTDINADLMPLGISAMAWGDYDNDGDLDLAISGCTDWFTGSGMVTKIYRNDNGTFVDIGAVLPGTWFGSLAWGDYDNDGRLDLLITGATGTRLPYPQYHDHSPTYPITVLYRNNAILLNTKPVAPNTLTAQRIGNALQLAWNASSDNQTPGTAITYNIRMGTTPGGSDIINPNSSASTGFRRLPDHGNASHRHSWTVKNLPAGKYYWSVQSVDNELAGSSFSEEHVISNYPTYTGWKLISVPDIHADTHAGTLYPTAISAAYAYDSESGYQSCDVLQNGKGYWMKFDPLVTPPTISGTPSSSINITVVPGWNLIGSISNPVLVSAITSSTPGMTTSKFFGFNVGYATSDTIQPGKGYWVKVDQAGSLTLGSSSAVSGQTSIRIVATEEMPPSPPGEVQTIAPDVPKEFSLAQNYPNPFNPSTRIEFSLPQAAHVTLKIFNVLGEEIATLISGQVTAGQHVQEWKAANISSGIYFYRLQAGSFTDTKKLVLLK